MISAQKIWTIFLYRTLDKTGNSGRNKAQKLTKHYLQLTPTFLYFRSYPPKMLLKVYSYNTAATCLSWAIHFSINSQLLMRLNDCVRGTLGIFYFSFVFNNLSIAGYWTNEAVVDKEKQNLQYQAKGWNTHINTPLTIVDTVALWVAICCSPVWLREMLIPAHWSCQWPEWAWGPILVNE